MSQELPIKSWHSIGESGAITRRAVSYTPASDMTLRHFSFVGMKRVNDNSLISGYTLTDMTAISWEIRADAGSNNKPGTATALASGTFDWRNNTEWKLWRPIKYTVNLASPLALTASTRYWFILKTYGDAVSPRYPLAWSDYYDTGAASEVDAAVYSSYYTGGAWATGVNTYNLTLYVLDAQAGSVWHTVIDGNGYKQPDNMRGYRCQQVASGLAQSRGGQSEFSQLRYPYANQSQNTWTTGAGQLNVEDLAAFLNSVSVDTTVPDQCIIGPDIHKTGTTAATVPYYNPTIVRERTLPDTDKGTAAAPVVYYAQKFTAPTGGTSMTKLGIRCSKKYWSGLDTLSINIYSDNAGSPNAALASWVAITPTTRYRWQDASITYSLASETAYWVVVKATVTNLHTPEYRVLFDSGGSATGGAAKYSANGSSWTALTGYSMAFRVNYAPMAALNGTVVAIKYGRVGSTDVLIAAAGKKVYQWNNSSGYWEDISTSIEGSADTTTANITDIVFFDSKLWVAQGYSNIVCMWNGSAWADQAYNAKYFHIGKGYLWMSATANTIKHTNDGTTLSAAITVGENLYDITAFANYSGKLLVGKEDGIWSVDDNDLASEYLLFREHANANNCIGMTVWSGMLFIPVQNSVWRWQGSQYKDVGPVANKAGPTSEWPNKVSRFASTPPYLFAAATPAVSTGYGGLMAYNGLGWHHISTHELANQTSTAICATSEIGTEQVRVWYGEGGWISYVKFPTFTNNRYDWTSADYDTSGGTLIHSWWDGGLKDALKFWNRLSIIADIPTYTSIEVYVGRDGTEWSSDSNYLFLGEITSQQLTDDGEYTLMFPDGMIAKSISLVLYLKTLDNSKTPRVRAINVESLVRQVPVYAYTFRVLMADNITRLDRVTDTRTANDIWEELQRLAARNEPIIVSFPTKSIRGVISSLTEDTNSFKSTGMDNETWERTAVVSVIEAL